jgi:hypothetical protein
MVGVRLPTRANPIQLIVTEPVSPLVHHLLAYADRHLTMKQMARGNLIIGGGWRATIDPDTGRPRVLRESVEGNLCAGENCGVAAGLTLEIIERSSIRTPRSEGQPSAHLGSTTDH